MDFPQQLSPTPIARVRSAEAMDAYLPERGRFASVHPSGLRDWRAYNEQEGSEMSAEGNVAGDWGGKIRLAKCDNQWQDTPADQFEQETPYHL